LETGDRRIGFKTALIHGVHTCSPFTTCNRKRSWRTVWVYLIAGIILAIIGFTATIYILTSIHVIYNALRPLPELMRALIIFTSFLIGVTGITLIPYGIIQYGDLELVITGKGKITKTLKLSRHEYIQLSKHLSM